MVGHVNTALRWMQAGFEAGLLWPALAINTFNQAHAAFAQSQLGVLLRQMEACDDDARIAITDWTASVSDATNFLDSAIRFEVPKEP